MTLEEALDAVKDQYGLLDSYVDATGRMLYVIGAAKELRAIPAVKTPESGLALFAPEVIDLARERITIEELARRKNPELFHWGGDPRSELQGPSYCLQR